MYYARMAIASTPSVLDTIPHDDFRKPWIVQPQLVASEVDNRLVSDYIFARKSHIKEMRKKTVCAAARLCSRKSTKACY